MGGYIAEKTKAVSFENGILFVWVKDSVWAQHLSLQKKQIINKLNRQVKTKILLDIRYQVGGKIPAAACEEKPVIQENWRNRALSNEKKKKIEEAFVNTHVPPDLEEQMKSFFTAQEKRIAWYREQGYPSCKVCGMPIVTAEREETCLCCKNGENG